MRQFKPRYLSEVVPFTPDGNITFRDIPVYYVLGGFCVRCKHIAELDRNALERRFGKDAPAHRLSKRMRCRHCKNKAGNTILVINQWPR